MDIGDLATIAGASPVAVILTQFAKAAGLPAKAVRGFALTTGLALVVVATLLAAPVTVGSVIVAIVIGAQAGLSAWSTFDLAAAGISFLRDGS